MRSQKITPPPSDPPHCTKFAWIAGGESWSCLILSQMYVDANYGNVFTQAQQRFWGFFLMTVEIRDVLSTIQEHHTHVVLVDAGSRREEAFGTEVDLGRWNKLFSLWSLNTGRWICEKLLKDMYLSKRKLLIGMGWGLMRNVCVKSQFRTAL